jgi:glyoxylase-like metal-dependent hydrolase (beta-lactamase superfamily II)
MKRVCALLLGLTLAGVVSVARMHAQDTGIEIVKVRKNFYMLAGAGGNIGVQIGSDGIVLVNTGGPGTSEKVLAALKTLTELPIRYIINVDAGPEFVAGNEKLARAGYTIFTNALGGGQGLPNGGGASILSHDSVLREMSKVKPAYPSGALPNEAFFTPRKAIRMNDEGLEVFYQPAAHSSADSFVLFRSSDVVVAGDVIDMNRFPVIDVAGGGTIQGEIAALNRLIDLTIAPTPFIYKDVGTYVIPGHGRLSEQMEIVDYRDMVVLVRDVVADLAKQGKTLDEIKAAKPALPYETRYGAQPGATTAFIESIYRTLQAKKS